MGPQADRIFPIFFGVWIVLGIFSTVFFLFNKNAQLKRKVWAPFGIFVGILFLTFLALMEAPREMFFIAVPMLILITIVNIRNVKFCDNCGKTVMSQNPFSPSKFCPQCGASLDTQDSANKS